MSKKNIALLFLIFTINITMGCYHEISWEEITSPDFVPRRSEAQLKDYKQQLDLIKQNKITPEEQILKDIFFLDVTKEQTIQEPIKVQYKLVRNSFPYWLEENVVHLVMFSTSNDWDQDTLKKKTMEQIQKQAPILLDTSLFMLSIHINDNSNRSVKGYAHSHVFVKSKSADASVFNAIKNLSFSKP